MKNTHFFKNYILVVLLFTGFTIYSQNKNIAVAIAVGETDCKYSTTDDLGYQIYTANSQSKAYDLATEKVKRDYPNYKRVAVEYNGYNGDKGNLVTIIETKTKYQGCDKYTFGIGFGTNYAESLKNAKKNLRMRNWNWVESSHGYKIVYEKGL